jgi:hypothetical protein
VATYRGSAFIPEFLLSKWRAQRLCESWAPPCRDVVRLREPLGRVEFRPRIDCKGKAYFLYSHRFRRRHKAGFSQFRKTENQPLRGNARMSWPSLLFGRKTGPHLLALRITGFDPKPDLSLPAIAASRKVLPRSDRHAGSPFISGWRTGNNRRPCLPSDPLWARPAEHRPFAAKGDNPAFRYAPEPCPLRVQGRSSTIPWRCSS